MYKVKKNTINLTRGDTLRLKVVILDSAGVQYEPSTDDTILFALKKNVADQNPLIEKIIPSDTCILHISPNDTKLLDFGSYFYDISITFANGDVCTFITKSIFNITEEIG